MGSQRIRRARFLTFTMKSLRHRFGDELTANGQHAAHDFVDVCAALAEDILAESGAVVASFTAGYPDEAAGD